LLQNKQTDILSSRANNVHQDRIVYYNGVFAYTIMKLPKFEHINKFHFIFWEVSYAICVTASKPHMNDGRKMDDIIL